MLEKLQILAQKLIAKRFQSKIAFNPSQRYFDKSSTSNSFELLFSQFIELLFSVHVTAM